MGLVQGGSEDKDGDQHLQFNAFRIVWDENIDRLTNMYGRLMIDRVKGFFGEHLVVSFGGASC